MEFNERLRIYFKKKGLSQKEVAERIGYSPTHMNYYFTKREPNWDLLSKLGIAFPQLDMNFLIKGEDKINGIVDDPAIHYGKDKTALIEDIQAKLNYLKEMDDTKVSRK